MSIKVAIIGSGFGARVHAPILQQHPAYELVAISSMRGISSDVAKRLDIPHFDNDWKRMMTGVPLDLVVIATQPGLHMEMACFALEAGLHVLCEKPPALGKGQALSMKEAAKNSNHIAAMNFEWRYLPERLAIKQVLDEKALGDIFHVNWSEALPLWPKIQNDPNTWFWQSDKGGGMLGALGSHMIDALHYWFGPLSKVSGLVSQRVSERLGLQGDLETSTADDSFFFNGHMTHGGTCSIQFTVAFVGRPPRLEIFGSKGTLIMEGKSVKIATAGSSEFVPVEFHPAIDVTKFPKEIHSFAEPQTVLYSHLASAISGESQPSLPDFSDAYYVQTVIDSILQSANTNTVIV